MEKFREWLGKNLVFAPLSEVERTDLINHALFRTLLKGEALAMQGDIWPYLFIVSEGELDAVKLSSEGRKLLVTTFRSGELFWGLAFFQENAPLIATLEARLPARVYLWSRQYLEPLFIKYGRMSWELCHLMIQRMQRANTIVEELAFQPVARRLARLLLDNFAGAQDASITRNLTLDDMASRIGTTREMVCRILYRLADQNLIEVTRTEFILNDQDGLLKISEGST